MILRSLDKHRDVGLLILRVGIGVMFLFHGYPKLAGGPETWSMVGLAVSNFGLSAYPAFWGFMAAISEFGGGLLLIAGFFLRPACVMMLCVMITATTMHLRQGDPFATFSHPIEDGIVFLSLILIGPGRFSLDDKLAPRKKSPPPS